MISKQRLASWLKHCKDLLRKKLPSEEHELYWRDYDKILCYRSIIAQVSKLIFDLFWLAFGTFYPEKT